MRTTLNIEDRLLERAARLTGISAKTSLVKMGLEALIAKVSSQRLAELAGSETKLHVRPRRRVAGK